MGLEISGRPADYYRTYLDNLRKVSAADVQRVAKNYLHPDNLVVILVGKRADMEDLPADLPLQAVALPPEYMEK
jgi:zinc protease